jgi:hypothetical protein
MGKLLFILTALGIFIFLGCQYKQQTQQKASQVEPAQASHVDQTAVIQAHNKTMQPFMESYCYSCHNEKKKKGKLRLDNLEFTPENLLIWQEVADQLTTEDMPPEDEKMPTAQERQQMISAILQNIEKLGKKSTQSVLRRLTKEEYVNTVRDLFEMRTEVFMGASEFPPDQRKHNFSNNGEALVTSSYLMDKYLDAANAVVDQVLTAETDKPQAQKLVFTAPFNTKTRDHPTWFYGKDKFQDILQNDTSLRNIYLHIGKFAKGAPERGLYKIRLTVEGKNRQKNPSPLGNTAEALSIKLAAGPQKDGDLSKATKSDKFIGEFPLPDNKPHVVELSTWLEKGYSLKMTFPQGLDTVKAAANRAYNINSPLIKGLDPKRYTKLKMFKWMTPEHGKMRRAPDSIASRWAVYGEEYSKKFPTLRVYKVEVEGPFHEEWPHRPKTTLLGDKTYDECNPQEVVSKLTTRAFRRPVSSEELEPILNFVDKTYKETGSKREAIANGIRVILCSPQFYYHYENEDRLDDYALASRLSYFMWSSMPDTRLMELAKAGKLNEEQTLKTELKRLLADPRSKQFTAKLADQWLELWKLGSMAPDEKTERQYYRRHLRELSKFETTELLDYILKENKPVTDIINADYTFMNRGLAEFYGVGDFHKYPTHDFVKTPVTDKRRRGILGHMGLLTASANGVDTSPIIRGLWVYETILGETAPPPPDSVPAIEPDLRNAKTIRDKLVTHRADKDCSVCHKKFDHFGFALENFDALGRWRTQYVEKGKRKKTIRIPISSYGNMINGDKFEDVSEMRQLLTDDKEMFYETVTSKLLTMAMGRETNAFDREQIAAIMNEAKSKGNGFKDILVAAVTSEIFKSK